METCRTCEVDLVMRDFDEFCFNCDKLFNAPSQSYATPRTGPRLTRRKGHNA